MSAEAKNFWRQSFLATVTLEIVIVQHVWRSGHAEDLTTGFLVGCFCIFLPCGMAAAFAWLWVRDWVRSIDAWMGHFSAKLNRHLASAASEVRSALGSVAARR